MHIQTHVISGWCIADLFNLTPRERALAMVAAAAADLDGLGLLVSVDYYAQYHHILAHNLLFGLVLAAVLTAFSTHRPKAFGLYLALFHLHLVMDYFGSGPGWGIPYFWPFATREYESPHAWPLASWQNFLATLLLFIWAIVIAIRRRRTPFEAIIPSLDAMIVQRIAHRTGKPLQDPST